MNMEEDARVEEEVVVILLLVDDDACLEGEWMGMVVALFIFGASRRRWPSLMVEHSKRERWWRRGNNTISNTTKQIQEEGEQEPG